MRRTFRLLIAIACTLSLTYLARYSRAGIAIAHALFRGAQVDRQARRDRMKEPAKYPLQAIPEIVVTTPSLQVAHVEIVAFGGSDGLSVTLHNKSDKAVNSFTFCTILDEADGLGGNSTAGETFANESAAGAIIAPYGEVTKTISGANIERDRPLTLCALTFVDGTQEGLPRIRAFEKKDYEEKKQRRTREGQQ